MSIKTIFFSVDQNDFAEAIFESPIFSQKVEALFRNAFSELHTPKAYLQSDFLTKPQAREYLGGISQPTFDKLVKNKVITAYRASEGRFVYYREELKAYLLNQKASA